MKKRLSVFFAGLALLCMTGMAQAALTTIGTASYNGGEYNLIYDADAPRGSIVWLDYSNPHWVYNWSGHNAWATGLNTTITTYNFDPGYTITWSGSWRLPSAGTNPQDGYNQTTSEMGHLYYDELGNPAGGPVSNTGDFTHLLAEGYWSGTSYSSLIGYHWWFNMKNGGQYINSDGTTTYYGLAVRGAQVSAVPIPGAVWLFSSGLLGLLGLKRKLRK